MPALPSNTFISEAFALITGETPHLALYTSNPTASDTGTEVAGGSYARQPITFGSITGGAISNTVAITFNSVPSATITHYGIKDAVTGGDLKVYGTLSSPIVAVSGDNVTIPVGQISIALSGS